MAFWSNLSDFPYNHVQFCPNAKFNMFLFTVIEGMGVQNVLLVPHTHFNWIALNLLITKWLEHMLCSIDEDFTKMPDDNRLFKIRTVMVRYGKGRFVKGRFPEENKMNNLTKPVCEVLWWYDLKYWNISMKPI